MDVIFCPVNEKYKVEFSLIRHPDDNLSIDIKSSNNLSSKNTLTHFHRRSDKENRLAIGK